MPFTPPTGAAWVRHPGSAIQGHGQGQSWGSWGLHPGIEREGRKRATGCARELLDVVRSPAPGCTGAPEPVMSAVAPHGHRPGRHRLWGEASP